MVSMEDIIEYRNKIMNRIIGSNEIAKLLNDEYVGDNSYLLAYSHVLPCEYVPDIVEETSSFVLFDLDVDLDRNNSSINNFTLYVYAISHKKSIRTPKGLKTDLLVKELQKAFQGHNIVGLGEMKLIFNHRYNNIQKDFVGRVMCFKIIDFTRRY